MVTKDIVDRLREGTMILHLNLHASEQFPINLYAQTKKNQDIKIKVTNGTTPVNVKILSHDSFSCEPQEDDGHTFYADQYLTFELNVIELKTMFATVEIYVLGECIGRTSLSSCHFPQVHGSLTLPLISPTNGQLAAEIKFDYLVIKRWRDQRLTDHPCRTLSTSKENFLYMGHRGCGKTIDRTASVLENTIPSFCAAQSLGASFVELDVLLTKDLVPVVFHDHDTSLCVEKKDGTRYAHPSRVHDLTLEDVKTSKMDFAREGAGTNYNNETYYNLFPTLEEVINDTPPSLGLFIEIKYPTQERESKLWETSGYHDRNVVVDQTLDVVMNCNEDKPIMFCSFDPEICILLQCKQHRFPVALITSGENSSWPENMDIRYRTRKIATNFALMNDLLGVSFYVNPLLEDNEEFSCIVSMLRKVGKHTFTWGSSNDHLKYVQYQRSLGVTGIISDRLENLSLDKR